MDLPTKRERRRERIDRGLKVRTEGIYALLSWQESCYLLLPRLFLVAGMLILPLFFSPVWQRVVSLAGIYALLAFGFDFLVSYVGLVSLGGALWMGIGGYVAGILGNYYGLPPVLTLPIATFVGAGISTLFLLPTLGLRGIYFAIATFVYPFIFTHIIEALQIAGGTFGLSDLPVIENKWINLYLMVVLVLLVMFSLRRLVSEDVGIVFRSMMENDQAVRASGINITLWKSFGVFIASCMGCFAGAYLCIMYGWVGLSYFALDYSVMPIAVVVVGGTGSFAGALLGTWILVPLSELLRAFGPLRMVLYAFILAFFVALKPEGLLPYLTRKYEQFERWVEV